MQVRSFLSDKFSEKKQTSIPMDKGKWMFAGVILGVVIVGVIIANIVQKKVAFVNKLTS
jgi:hypothetical protein